MPGNTTTHTVQWGDCDPLGIVFYPNFYRWMDEGSWALFNGRGLTLDAMEERFGSLGAPLVETGCAFKSPVRPRDVLTIESRVVEWSTRSFRMAHTFKCEDRLVAEGFEVRVWVLDAPDHPAGIKSGDIPQEVKDLLS